MKFSKRFLTIALYSLGVTGSIYISITRLVREGNSSVFVIFSLLALFIFVSEVLIDYVYKNKRVEINFDVNDEVNEASEILNKLLLPLLLFISVFGYTYFNFSGRFVLIIYGIIYFAFLLLFLNIKAFFELDVKTERSTNIVYDLIKFIIFYCFVDTIINMVNAGSISHIVYVILYLALFVILSYLFLIRYVKDFAVIKRYLWIQVLAAVVSLLIIFLIGNYSPILLSLSSFFVFYSSLAIIHHIVDNTLSKWVLFEYILVLIMALSVLIGIG